MNRLTLASRVAVALAALFFATPSLASAQVSIGLSVNIGPPALPVYEQPPCPQPNYIWVPGYWAWGDAGYYWVPGTWAVAPQPGLLWTPGYWGYAGSGYGWHPGYWATRVGYYGGINYGFGYFGSNYVGGAWYGSAFRYNTAVTNVNTTVVRNVYVNKTVVNNYNTTTINRVSYNGGPGGVRATPTPEERLVAHEHHYPMTDEQRVHVRTAASDRNLLASVNHGAPRTLAVAQPFNKTNRPPGYTPVATEDRRAAQEHVISQPHTNAAEPGYTGHPATESHPSYAHPSTEHPPASQHPPTYGSGSQHPPSYSSENQRPAGYTSGDQHPPSNYQHPPANGHPPGNPHPPANGHPQSGEHPSSHPNNEGKPEGH